MQGHANLPQVRAIQASAFQSVVYILDLTGQVSLFADLVLPSPPWTALFSQPQFDPLHSKEAFLGALHFPFRRWEAKQPNGEQQ